MSGCIDQSLLDPGTSWEVSGELHAPAALLSRKDPPGTHWIGSWVGPRVGLNDIGKCKFLTLPGLELRPHGR
jgi:hypothetical protein